MNTDRDKGSIKGQVSVIRQKKAVPPGYLHDLLHSRHLMKTVGLRSNVSVGGASQWVTTGSKLMQSLQGGGKRMHNSAAGSNKPSLSGTPTLPELFEQRKRFLQKKKQKEEETPYRCRPDDPVGLLSLPEDVLLKVVCYLRHEEIAPLFLVCKELGNTLRNAIKFHFNYATPTMQLNEEDAMPLAKRHHKRRRAVTAYADVMAHLQKGQRNVVQKEAPGSTHSTGPRALRFTPQTTPLANTSHRGERPEPLTTAGIGGVKF